MKNLLLFTIAICFGLYTFGQQGAKIPKINQNNTVIKERKMAVKDGDNESSKQYKPGEKALSMLDEEMIGESMYDLQSNTSPQNRLYLFDDGTMGCVWTIDDQPNSGNRGTGYNYFDGTSWGPEPTARIEDTKTGWPSYTNYGENGELFVCHHMTEGLLYGIRETKGEGDWDIDIQEGPATSADISWPRGVTSGENNDVIHFLSVTYTMYLGQTNGIIYSRSEDGGLTWDPENYNFEELGIEYYDDIGGDVYDWAEPNADKLAFLVGNLWTDLILMTSEDDGESWDMTKVWESPSPQNLGTPSDTMYCPDGSHHLVIDNDGMVHVVFSLTRVQTDDFSTYSWWPEVNGIVYWNETMPTFSSDVNALSPYGDPGSELIVDYNLIGWAQDINGNGEIDIADPSGIADYNTGLVSHAQLVIDDLNRFFLVFSGVTETHVNSAGTQNYRHVWVRGSIDGGNSWGDFVDVHSDITYSFDECVFTSAAPSTDGNIYFYYQADYEPGMNIQGDMDPAAPNYMRVMSVSEDVFFPVGVEENITAFTAENVSQNYPNPFTGTSSVFINLDKEADLELVVTNIVGQRVYTIPEQHYSKGRQKMIIDASGFPAGVYFYTINSGDKSLTKKMIVE